MGRLTLRLPETLHQQLIDLSENARKIRKSRCARNKQNLIY